MTSASPYVLVVEDDPAMSALVRALLSDAGYAVETVATMFDALEVLALHSSSFQAVVLDLDLPDSHGMNSLSLTLSGCEVPVIVHSGNVEPGAPAEARAMGAAAFVVKSADAAGLIQALDRSLGTSRGGAVPTPLYGGPGDDQPDFLRTVRRTLEFLADQMPMGLWMFTRVNGDRRMVIDAVGDAYPVRTGMDLGWSASLCHRMVTSDAPRVANDLQRSDAYRDVPDVATFGIQRYSGWPVSTGGHLFGTLCGIDPAVGSQDPSAVEPLLAYAGDMLTAALSADLERDRLKRRLDLAKMASRTDSLTGLANRRAFDLMLKLEQARIRRYGHDATIVIVDLNDLKDVNDTRGHAQGDRLISRTADVLSDTVRASDSAFRIGGDEFAILATPCGADDARVLEDRLRHSLRTAEVSAAVGVATKQPESSLLEAVLEADERMYADKTERPRPA